MGDSSDLVSKGLADCAAHAQSLLTGDVSVTVERGDASWDGAALRSVLDLSMTVWRRCGKFDVVMDGADVPVGFVDHGALAACRWVPLSAARAAALARETGMVPRTLDLAETRKGEGDCLELVFTAAKPAGQAVRVRIDPSRQVVVAVEPQPRSAS